MRDRDIDRYARVTGERLAVEGPEGLRAGRGLPLASDFHVPASGKVRKPTVNSLKSPRFHAFPLSEDCIRLPLGGE